MALVVFLKGINVGGHRRIRPTELAKQLQRYDVANIGAAGTFVVRAPVNQTKFRAELKRRLPFEAEVMICSGSDILALASTDPFEHEPSDRSVMQFVSVRGDRRSASAPPSVVIPASGEWEMKVLDHSDRFVIGICRRQMKAIGHFGQLEKIFGSATTRSWSTILKIARILEQPTNQRRARSPSQSKASRIKRS
ncbi:MAG TPA: DUF1697 domain-containing protein [Gemmatimonadaceae bacterium]|jgi:uncharacterized protein (DUF1697 family)|nr:DUF1697 domain-containing protein [Gemmatimonadaceae bacterium]